MAKKKNQPIDGLGPKEIAKIRSAVRQVWHRCKARQLVVKRCKNEAGYYVCEQCKEQTPEIKIDHIQNVGDVDEGFILRMFVPSDKLQGLCKACHNEKTKEERKALKK